MKRIFRWISCVVTAACVLTIAGAARGDLVSGSGEWESSSGVGMRGTWTVVLERSGASVKGTVTLTGSTLFSGAEVSGTMQGDQVLFGTVVDGKSQLSFSGTITDGQVRGEWQSAVINDSGAWSGTLRTPVTREEPETGAE